MKVKKTILSALSNQQVKDLYDFAIKQLVVKATRKDLSIQNWELDSSKVVSINFLINQGSKNYIFMPPGQNLWEISKFIDIDYSPWGLYTSDANEARERLTSSRDQFFEDYGLNPIDLVLLDTGLYGKQEQVKSMIKFLSISGLDDAIFGHSIYQVEYNKPKVEKLCSFGTIQYENIANLVIQSVFDILYKETLVSIGPFKVADQVCPYDFALVVEEKCQDANILYLFKRRHRSEPAGIDKTGRQLANAIEAFGSLMLGETWRDQLSSIDNEHLQRLLEIYYPAGAINLISNYPTVRALAIKSAKSL